MVKYDGEFDFAEMSASEAWETFGGDEAKLRAYLAERAAAREVKKAELIEKLRHRIEKAKAEPNPDPSTLDGLERAIDEVEKI